MSKKPKSLTELSTEIEKVSKIYSEKFDITRDSDWFVLKLQEELGELIQSYLMMIGQARKKGKSQEEITAAFKGELADVFAHVLLLAKFYEVDLDKEIEKKWLQWGK